MSYAEVQRQIPDEQQMACRWCEMATSVVTLSQYGGRCFPCFERYLVTPQKPTSREIADRNAGGHRAWALHLKAREQRGETLSIFQRLAWRDALAIGLTVGEDA